MLIYVILLSSDCFKVQGHLVPRLFTVFTNQDERRFSYHSYLDSWHISDIEEEKGYSIHVKSTAPFFHLSLLEALWN